MDIAKTIRLAPGSYVLAVSGGVDSMALLDMLARTYHLPAKNHRGMQTAEDGSKTGSSTRRRFVVAHLDHGIRPDSRQDRRLIQDVATQYGLPFVFDEARLGPQASEATARKVRYQFLRTV